MGVVAVLGPGCQAILGIGDTSVSSGGPDAAGQPDVAGPDTPGQPDAPPGQPDAGPDAPPGQPDAGPDATPPVDVVIPDAMPSVTLALASPVWLVRGDTQNVTIAITRGGGFNGQVTVGMIDLPSVQVAATKMTVGSGATFATVQLSGSTTAPLGQFHVSLQAQTSLGTMTYPATLEIADPPGTIDESFGDQGLVYLPCDSSCGANALAVQMDGGIVIGGSDASGRWLLQRLDPSGVVQATYGNAPTGTIYSVALIGDGRVLAGGSAGGGAIGRFAPDMSLDGTFGNGASGTGLSRHGDAQTPVSAIAYDAHGKIAFANTPLAGSATICRIDGEGRTLDPAFNSGSCVTPATGTTSIGGMVISPDDGTILAIGNHTFPNPLSQQLFAVEVTDSGGPQTGFGNNGVLNASPRASSFGTAVAFSGGLPILAGYGNAAASPSQYLLARVNAAGMIDDTFGNGFIAGSYLGSDSYAQAVAAQSDGYIVIAGYGATGTSDHELATVTRFDPSGVPDTHFGKGGGGVVSLDDDGGDDMEFVAIGLAPDGRIVVAGARLGSMPGVIVARYWP
jgi:uncharacterized delta-60 repeat protein